jgi:hypothetical protein
MSPKRIQRRRTPGWRMPEGAIYVGRPSKWGNPILGGDAARKVELFRILIHSRPPGLTPADLRRDLGGRDLACWCPVDQPCHADVLLEHANPTARGSAG